MGLSIKRAKVSVFYRHPPRGSLGNLDTIKLQRVPREQEHKTTYGMTSLMPLLFLYCIVEDVRLDGPMRKRTTAKEIICTGTDRQPLLYRGPMTSENQTCQEVAGRALLSANITNMHVSADVLHPTSL